MHSPQEQMTLLNELYSKTATLKADAVTQYVEDLLEVGSRA